MLLQVTRTLNDFSEDTHIFVVKNSHNILNYEVCDIKNIVESPNISDDLKRDSEQFELSLEIILYIQRSFLSIPQIEHQQFIELLESLDRHGAKYIYVEKFRSIGLRSLAFGAYNYAIGCIGDRKDSGYIVILGESDNNFEYLYLTFEQIEYIVKEFTNPNYTRSLVV